MNKENLDNNHALKKRGAFNVSLLLLPKVFCCIFHGLNQF